MTEKFISIEGIAKRYPGADGGEIAVFEKLWLSMARGEFGCVIGHSGCGKTTVLNILAGLDQPSGGTMIVDGQAIEATTLDPAVMLPTEVAEAIYRADKSFLMTNGPGAGLAEIVETPLPKDRGRIDLHRHPYYYAVRNHIVDFLVSRSKTFATDVPGHDPRHVPVVKIGKPELVIAAVSDAPHDESKQASGPGQAPT